MRAAPAAALALLLGATGGAQASCATSSLTLPALPASTRSAAVATPVTLNHWSEAVTLARRPIVTPVAQQTSCPHLDPAVVPWESAATWQGAGVPVNGSLVTLPANTKVLVSKCSQLSGFIFDVVTVPATSELIFADNDALSFDAYGINVLGALRAGSPTCRLAGRLTITLHGSRNAQVNPGASYVKGILVDGGTLDLHGVQYQPTWTRLATTANAGDTWILVQDVVNWEAGQAIVITTTEIKDTRDFNRNDPATIAQVQLSSLDPSLSWIQLTAPLQYTHYGGSEYQAEVLLLSRRIVVQGDADNSEPTDTYPLVCSDNVVYYGAQNVVSTAPCTQSFLTGFGAHMRVQGSGANGRLSGVEMFRMGQTNVLGRYPIHFHLVGNATNSWVKESSVHRSYFRCYAVHGTYNVTLLENTAYDAIGHCYFLEDGVEERNSFLYNAGALVHTLGNPQYMSDPSLFYGQQLLDTYQNDNLILPDDLTASVFYVTNAYNTFIGNAASGGFAGFSFPALLLPVKLFANVVNLVPKNRPLIAFDGNSAHSSGYWWESAGALYLGGLLTQNSSGVLVYNPGRGSSGLASRQTCADPTAGTSANPYCSSANTLFMVFTNTKLFLANRGLQDWGDRARFLAIEIHDVNLAMNVFGQVEIHGMLMECRSNNMPTWMSGCNAYAKPSQKPYNSTASCATRDTAFFSSMRGFQWYDTGQQHLLSNSTFRNCNASQWAPKANCVYGCGVNSSSSAFSMLTHSDQFLPQLMQVSKQIVYENVDTNLLWQTTTSSSAVPGGITASGRLQNWLDFDGSASMVFPIGTPTRLGSSWSREWWKLNNQCVLKQQFWVCPLQTGDSAASVYIEWDTAVTGLTVPNQTTIGSGSCINGNYNAQAPTPCPVIGSVTHFGRTIGTGLDLPVNAQVTGPLIRSAGGWYLNFNLSTNGGTPAVLSFSRLQVSVNDVLLVAIPYPASTSFTITAYGASWCSKTSQCSHSFTAVSSLQKVVNGSGDVYFFDSTKGILFLRIVQFDTGYFNNVPTGPWATLPQTFDNVFAADGLTLVDQQYAGLYAVSVVASNCNENANGLCAINPAAQVPPAFVSVSQGALNSHVSGAVQVSVLFYFYFVNAVVAGGYYSA